jgi:hypothetical protein
LRERTDKQPLLPYPADDKNNPSQRNARDAIKKRKEKKIENKRKDKPNNLDQNKRYPYN